MNLGLTANPHEWVIFVYSCNIRGSSFSFDDSFLSNFPLNFLKNTKDCLFAFFILLTSSQSLTDDMFSLWICLLSWRKPSVLVSCLLHVCDWLIGFEGYWFERRRIWTCHQTSEPANKWADTRTTCWNFPFFLLFFWLLCLTRIF